MPGCSICIDNFKNDDNVSILPCGHVFHHQCVVKWIVDNQTCPQCRVKTRYEAIQPIYFTFDSGGETELGEVDVLNLKREIATLKTENCQLLSSKVKHEESIAKLESTVAEKTESIKAEKNSNVHLRQQVNQLKVRAAEGDKAKERNQRIEKELENFQQIADIVKKELIEEDIKEMAKTKNSSELLQWVVVINRELKIKKKKFKEVQSQLSETTSKLSCTKTELRETKDELVRAIVAKKKAEEELQTLQARQESSKATRRANVLDFSLTDMSDSPCVASSSRYQEIPKVKPVKPKPAVFSLTSNKPKLNPLKIVGGSFLNNSSPTNIKLGYNGMGGHETFIQPRRSVAGPPIKRAKKPTNEKLPPLPGLDTFFSDS